MGLQVGIETLRPAGRPHGWGSQGRPSGKEIHVGGQAGGTVHVPTKGSCEGSPMGEDGHGAPS